MQAFVWNSLDDEVIRKLKICFRKLPRNTHFKCIAFCCNFLITYRAVLQSSVTLSKCNLLIRSKFKIKASTLSRLELSLWKMLSGHTQIKAPAFIVGLRNKKSRGNFRSPGEKTKFCPGLGIPTRPDFSVQFGISRCCSGLLSVNKILCTHVLYVNLGALNPSPPSESL